MPWLGNGAAPVAGYFPRSQLFRVPVVATVVLAAAVVWLRLRLLGYTEIWQDQAVTLNVALEWVRGGALPLASLKSSFGVFNPPLIEYLYALPLWMGGGVVSEAWLVALANLAGLLAAGLATARVFGLRTAWWASLLFAVNPWAVYYGRLVWMQSFEPACAALFYACVLLYFAAGARAWTVIAGAASLSAAMQVHLTAVVLLLVLAVLMVVLPGRRRWRPWLAGAAVFVLTWLPFMLFEWRAGFVDLAALRAGLGQTARVSDAALLILFDLLQSKGVFATLGRAAGQWQSLDAFWPQADALVAATFVAASLALAGAAGLALRARRSPRALDPVAAGRLIVLIWAFVPLLAFVRHNQYLQNYYFLYLFPAPFVIMALASDQAYSWLRQRLSARPVGGGRGLLDPASWAPALAFVPIGLIALQQGRLDIVGQNLAAAGAAGRERLVDVNQLILTTRELLGQRASCQLVVISDGDQYESSRFALLREFAAPNPVRFLSATGGYLVPATCAVYLDTEQQPDLEAWLSSVALPLPRALIRTPEAEWRFFDLPPEQRAAAAQTMAGEPALAEWGNGLQLGRVELRGRPVAGQWLEVRSAWRVTQAVRPQALHFGTYLLDAAGNLVSQADGAGVDSAGWVQGDVFSTVFSLSLPPGLPAGSYSLATALYRYPEIDRLNLVNGGNLFTIEKLTVASQ